MDVKKEFPYPEVENELGELLFTEEECLGVYYVSACNIFSDLPVEYYIVESQADTISSQAKTYGLPLGSQSELLAYEIGDEQSGYHIIRYESLLYRVRNGNIALEKELLSAAVFGTESNPEYFGTFPAPRRTPCGQTVRYRQIMPGVYALATSTGAKLISVAYPIWDGDLSDYTTRLGIQTEYDLANGIHNTFGDLFFSEETGCLALFELSLEHEIDSEVVNMAAARNAVFDRYPEYMVSHNKREITGLNDVGGLMLRLIDADCELSGRENNLLTVIPEAGTDYLKI